MTMEQLSSSEDKEKHKEKRRRKESIRRRRKKEKRRKKQHKSSSRMRVQTHGASIQHSLLKNQTLWPKMRGPVEEGGVGEEQERRPEEGAVEAQGSPCLQGGCELCLPGASSGRLTSGWRAFPLVLLPADPVGPNSLEIPRAGRPDEGKL